MQQDINSADGSYGEDNEEKKMTNPEEDGRNKEWQDRGRVNLEEVPEGTHTTVERDFEPETPPAEKKNADKKDGSNY